MKTSGIVYPEYMRDLTTHELNHMGWESFHAENFEVAVQAWEASADKGNLDAKYWLGWRYLHGEGVDKKPEVTKRLWEELSNIGMAKAQNALAWRYCNGDIVKRD